MTLYTTHYAETIFKHLKQRIEKLDLERLAGPRRRDCSYTSRTRKDIWKEYGDQYDPNLTDIAILDIRQFIQELDGVLLSIDSGTAEDLSKVADYMTALNLCYRQLSSGSVPTDKCEASFKELMSLRKARYMLDNAYQGLKDVPEMEETIHHWFIEWDRRLYKCYIRTKLLFDEHSLIQYRKMLDREERRPNLFKNSLVDYALMIIRFLKCLPTPTFKNYMSIKALVNERIVSFYSAFQRLMDLIDAVINDNDAAVELIATNLGIPAPGSDNTQLKQSKKNEPGVGTRAHKKNVTEDDLQSIFQYLDANKDRYLSFPGGDDYASFYSEDGTKDVTVYLDNHEGMRAVIVCPDYDSVKPMLLHLAQMMQTIPEFLSISTKERLVVFPNNDGFSGTIRESNLHVKMDIRITYDDMVYHWKNGTLVEDEGNPIAKLLQDCGRQNQ